MPTKRTTNKLSQLYKTIDQKELSADAKKALADLRLATGNFRKKEGKEADAFMLFYNRLVNKKPTAVKTTKEYKAMLTERRRENGRKAMEARKAKQESRQGQGSERDAARPAKPFGWRLKGKHNYRKPTREDIRTGKAYYEARINRADSKRTKFPMLERGGEIEKQEKLINYKIASVIGIDETFKYLDMDFVVSPLQLIRGAVIRGFISVDEINRDLFDAALSESYYIDEIYKDSGQGIGSSDETAFIANMLRNAGIDVKVVNGRWQRMAEGGFMEDGGEMDMLKEDQAVWNAVGTKLLVDKVTNDEYYLTSFMQAGSSPFSKEKVHRYLKNGEWTLKPKMDRDVITGAYKFAKGGAIKYSTYDNKSMEYIEGEIAHTERSARQFQQMGDYESMEDRQEHVKKLREIYNKKRAESKMAKGGVFYTDSHKQGH